MSTKKELKKLRKKWYKNGKTHGENVVWDPWYSNFIHSPYSLTDLNQRILTKYEKEGFYSDFIISDIEKDVKETCDELNGKEPCSNPKGIEELRTEMEEAWKSGFKKGIVEEIPIFEEFNLAKKKFREMGEKGELGHYSGNFTLVDKAKYHAKEIAKNDKVCVIEPNGEECNELIDEISIELQNAYRESYEDEE